MRMKACNMFLIPLNTNPFAESIFTECAYVSFPGTDLNPVIVATCKEFTREDIAEYLKSIGMVFDNYRITCFARKTENPREEVKN